MSPFALFEDKKCIVVLCCSDNVCEKGHDKYDKEDCSKKKDQDDQKEILLNVGIACILLSLLCLIPSIVLLVVLYITGRNKKSSSLDGFQPRAVISRGRAPSAYDYVTGQVSNMSFQHITIFLLLLFNHANL